MGRTGERVRWAAGGRSPGGHRVGQRTGKSTSEKEKESNRMVRRNDHEREKGRQRKRSDEEKNVPKYMGLCVCVFYTEMALYCKNFFKNMEWLDTDGGKLVG